jgi:hypothetical protein
MIVLWCSPGSFGSGKPLDNLALSAEFSEFSPKRQFELQHIPGSGIEVYETCQVQVRPR